jgi:transposase
VTAEQVLGIQDLELSKTPKSKLLRMLMIMRSQLLKERQSHQEEVAELRAKISDYTSAADKTKKQEINKTVNQPSSKKPEWEKGAPQKKGRRRKKRRGREGAGNRPKPVPEIENENPLVECPQCSTDLSDRAVIENPTRVVEDVAPPPKKTVVSLEIQETKWCPVCHEVVSSRSERALPKSDVGIHATVLTAYLWVVAAISLPGIVAYLKSFFRITLSTAGISRMMIRVGKILAPVHEEILQDVKGGAMIFADETGWRVHGELWWLWIFANARSSFYWPDRLRGSPVVEKILGTVFSGVLITDAWCAYQAIVCAKQTCLAHIFRKIRKFRDAYPQYWTIIAFYKRLRRLVEDGERLKKKRDEIGEEVFERRLRLLERRLDEVLAWKNPNSVLSEVIQKVARQKQYILTFVKYEGVPKHNNYGEYIIKRGILKRKVSGGSMSPEGAMAYARIQSVAMTCHLRRFSFRDYLFRCLVHFIRTGRPLLLADYEHQFVNPKTQEKKAA